MKALAIVLVLAGFAGMPSAVSDALNTAVNSVFDAASASNRQGTKIVPIVSAVGGTRGFAQIEGSAQALKATTAVVEITTSSAWTITAFIPVAHFDATSGTFHREYGVSVNALINHPL